MFPFPPVLCSIPSPLYHFPRCTEATLGLLVLLRALLRWERRATSRVWLADGVSHWPVWKSCPTPILPPPNSAAVLES